MNRRQFLQGTTAGSATLALNSASAFTNSVSSTNNAFPPLQTFSFESVTVDRKGKIATLTPHEAQYFNQQIDELTNLKMVAIQGGSSLVGRTDQTQNISAYESNAKYFDIEPFYLGQTTITQSQWRAIASLPAVNKEIAPEPACFIGTDNPVECVSWNDAQEFCSRLSVLSGRNYRLPTETEWEHACRAGTTSPFHYGATLTSDIANYDAHYAYDAEQHSAYRRSTLPVGQLAPNANGLYDMHGNVWEWCSDVWHDKYQTSISLAKDRVLNRHALRGGSWADLPVKLRSASRVGYSAQSLNRIIGFRIALSLETV